MGDDQRFQNFKAKLGRADEHLDRLTQDILAFTNSDAYKVVFRPGSQPNEWVGVVQVERDLPAEDLALTAGDCLHNLRSALDYLVWELADPPDPPRTKFPICDKKRKFKKAREVALKNVSPEAQTLIEGMQPYNDPKGVNRNPYRRLRKLSNEDKHRLLHVVVAAPRGVIYPNRPGSVEFAEGALTGPVVAGDELGSIVVEPGTERDLEAEFEFEFGVEFATGPAEGFSVEGTLRMIREYIRVDIQNKLATLP